MSTVWRRLLWKQFREGRWVVVIAILAPVICFPLAGRYQFDSWEGESRMKRCCINRHDGFIGMAFLDFSARKVGLKELWTLKWHRQFNTSGPWTQAGGLQAGDWPEWIRNLKDY